MRKVTKQKYEQEIHDLMLCGHTREEAEKLATAFYNTSYADWLKERELHQKDIEKETQSQMFQESQSVKREKMLRQIKGFNKVTRDKKVAALISIGKTKQEALEIVNTDFKNVIRDTLRQADACSVFEMLPQNKTKKGFTSISVPPITEIEVEYYKLLLKGYTSDEAMRMIDEGLDDLS